MKTGAYMIIDKAAKDLELDTKLQDSFGAKAAGIMLDLAAYSIITEVNAAQYILIMLTITRFFLRI